MFLLSHVPVRAWFIFYTIQRKETLDKFDRLKSKKDNTNLDKPEKILSKLNFWIPRCLKGSLF